MLWLTFVKKDRIKVLFGNSDDDVPKQNIVLTKKPEGKENFFPKNLKRMEH